jgi:hypothetical protein
MLRDDGGAASVCWGLLNVVLKRCEGVVAPVGCWFRAPAQLSLGNSHGDPPGVNLGKCLVSLLADAWVYSVEWMYGCGVVRAGSRERQRRALARPAKRGQRWTGCAQHATPMALAAATHGNIVKRLRAAVRSITGAGQGAFLSVRGLQR